MTTPILRAVDAAHAQRAKRDPVDAETLARAATLVNDVRRRGAAALREHAEALGDIPAGAPLTLEKAQLQQALATLPSPARAVLERTAARISAFATAQKATLRGLDMAVPGGRAGHQIAPVERAGCYAPGGRFPLPSSVLMTAVTARIAGVRDVWVASPKPTLVTQAAAAVAGADGLLCAGGAHAIAALAYGAAPVPACDAVVGPGNRFVTAAKQLVAGRVAIDMLAGPSELVILADDSANPAVVAADLLAQAEHDPDAFASLVTWSAALVDAVNAELARQLTGLPTADTARAALAASFCVHVANVDEAITVCDALAPEHLELHLRDASRMASRLNHYGGLFIGATAAEVFGDYGTGPNHVLPTSLSARFTGGLSVLNFLRVRTYLRMDSAPKELIEDAAALARLEGLEAHARAAEARLEVTPTPSHEAVLANVHNE